MEHHRDRLQSEFPSSGPDDRNFAAFIRSPSDFGDPELERLRLRALKASRNSMRPLIALLMLFVVVYVVTAILALLK